MIIRCAVCGRRIGDEGEVTDGVCSMFCAAIKKSYDLGKGEASCFDSLRDYSEHVMTALTAEPTPV